jgi:hypothetical protein
MLVHLNVHDWVSLWENGNLLKVARIEHKFVLTGKEAKTYNKNHVDVLMIRHLDKLDMTISKGLLKTKYLVIDAETGKELAGKLHHNLEIQPVPACRNVVVSDSNSKTWAEMIEQQQLIYQFSDFDWKTVNVTVLQKVANVLSFSGTISECK